MCSSDLREWEKRWRHSDDKHVFMFSYLEGERPKDAEDYEPTFVGESQGAMDYLIRNRANWMDSTRGGLPDSPGKSTEAPKKGFVRRFLDLFI